MSDIDAVYTWVNGRTDINWLETYKNTAKKFGVNDTPHYNRYGNFGELEFSIKTLRHFAPFIRNIYVVTDNQIPEIDLQLYNVKVVNHREIFDKHAHYPTFNSNVIESYLHRIPGLSGNSS